MNKLNIYTILAALLFALSGCSEFEEMNINPNEPTQVSADVLLPNAIRESVNTAVDASFLVGNNAAQLTAKTLRTEVDAYNWNAFPSYWEGWYESLVDLRSIESIALDNANEQMQGVVITLRSWVFANLTNAYGNVPYFEATKGNESNFTPVYDDQEAIYMDLLSELDRANTLLQGSGTIDGDILLDGDALAWQKFANSLRLRLLMYASNSMDVSAEFSSIVNNQPILENNSDNVELVYTGSFPNEFPLIPLKIGDADAVAIAKASVDVMLENSDPRLNRYTRPNSDDFTDVTDYIGAVNGPGSECLKDGASRLGLQYYNYPSLKKASEFGLANANGVIMQYAEVAFLRAEAIEKGWISGNSETEYKNGIQASLEYHAVEYSPFGFNDFEDYYTNSGVAYSTKTDIWQQKWLALFFNGLEPYFELRRWYNEGGNSFDGIPFIDATCGNINGDRLPLRFLYPGEEQSLNASNYQAAINEIGGNDQNISMWILE
jgi:hypothetical protein